MQKGEPNNSDILQNWFLPEIKNPVFNLYKFENHEGSTPESYKMDWNLMNDEEFGSRKVLKLKYRRGGQKIQTFCKIDSIQKLNPPSLICSNLKKLREVLLKTYKMHWNLINDEEFGFKTFLELKYRRGNQIIQTFWKIGSPQKLGPSSLICRNFGTLRKVLLMHAEWIEI